MKAHLLFLIVLTLALGSCSDDPDLELVIMPVNSKILLDANGRFVDASGELFFPWGLNYTNAAGVGLLEDSWQDEEVWAEIQEDFQDMKRLSANVVRIHLQYNKFMIDAVTPNQAALEQLSEVVRLAESTGLYLDITGLAAYRKSDGPDFYNNMTDEERWETQKPFWKSIANEVGESPAVFAYNLMNEPVVSVRCDGSASCDWAPGDGLGGFHFVQNITRDPGKSYLPTMRAWIAELTQAIREEDDTTMITVGFLGLGPVKRFAADLDYVSVHIYPESDNIRDAVDYIRTNGEDITLVIEETSNLNCSISELSSFVEMIDGRYAGLMGHYHGVSIDELGSFDFRDALRKQFLNFFKDNAPE